MAERRDHVVVSPHGDRADEYYWMRDDTREDPAVLAYLTAENAYKDAMLASVRELEDTLFDEIVGRIQQEDTSVPVLHHGWLHYVRYEQGSQYAIHARRKSADSEEQIVVDVNQRAEGHDFFSLLAVQTNPAGTLASWAEDPVGRRQFQIRAKDMATGELLDDLVENTTGSMAWFNDNQSFLYIDKDPVTLLGVRVKRHRIGTDPADDPVVYEELDCSYYLTVRRTRDDRYVLISCSSTVSDETRFIDADDPDGEWTVLVPRKRGHEYSAQHVPGQWLLRSNHEATNFRIMALADADAGSRDAWTEVVAASDDVTISDFICVGDILAINERSGGLRRIRMRPTDGSEPWFLESDESAYAMYLGANPKLDTEWLRYGYGSLTTPQTTREIHLRTRVKRVLKVTPVPTYDPSRYTTERVWATARDGKKVPISVVYRSDILRDGTAPVYLNSYGSYGSSSDPWFRSTVVSLLDRGVVYAIAHIRGGEEMGRCWYDDGKLLNKMNTFTDFIDCAEHLVAEGWAAPNRVAISGGSAGGLLMGVVVNMRPDLFRVVAALVPFVDVVTTMLDESIPLTTNEFDEWGNPKNKQYYDYMLSYSPYDRVTESPYPAMLVTTGLWDSQVQYFEPAKWVARLRARSTGTAPLLFHVNMDAGHGGKSGRFKRQRETAMEFAFILDQLGATD